MDPAQGSRERISAYTAEPGTPSDDALNLLATWAATLDQAEQPDQPDQAETAGAADGT